MAQGLPNAGLGAVPTIPYRNVLAMADWLCSSFGFQKQSVARDDSGEVKHAQLTFGDSTIMVFPVQDFASEKLIAHPDQVGGLETQTCYLVVADVEAHCERAKANGAEIIFDVRSGRYGGKGYAARDPEGHVWMFGTYDPRKSGSLVTGNASRPQRSSSRAHVRTAALTVLALVSAGVAIWAFRATQGTALSALWSAPRSADATDQLVQKEQGARLAAERDAKDLAAKLTEVRAAKDSAEQDKSELIARLAHESAAAKGARQSEQEARQLLARAILERDTLALAAKDFEKQAAQARNAREAAAKAARDAADQLDQARLTKVAAERATKETSEKCAQEQMRAAKDALDRLTRERNARAAAELAANELRNQLASFAGNDSQNLIHDLRRQIEAERRTRSKMESEAQDAKLLFAQEKYSRDATERALKQAQQKLAANQASCWACPTGAVCERPK
jgi:uncharacterized glyoxalase superfamily protein PhnB